MELTTLHPITLYASVFGLPLIQVLCILYLIMVSKISIKADFIILFLMIISSVYSVYFFYTLPYYELISLAYFGYWMILVLVPIKLYMGWSHQIIYYIGYFVLFSYTTIQVFHFFEYYGYYYGLIK